MFFSVPCNSLYFKVYSLSVMSVSASAFFWFVFTWNNFFHPITFSLYVFLDLSGSLIESLYSGHVFVSIQLVCLFVETINSFLFKVIINMYVLTFILLLVLHSYFCKSFHFLPLLFSCDLVVSLVLYLDAFYFLYVYLLWFLICKYMRFWYNSLYIYKIVLNFWSLVSNTISVAYICTLFSWFLVKVFVFVYGGIFYHYVWYAFTGELFHFIIF